MERQTVLTKEMSWTPRHLFFSLRAQGAPKTSMGNSILPFPWRLLPEFVPRHRPQGQEDDTRVDLLWDNFRFQSCDENSDSSFINLVDF
jgi:hypothetical protein